MPGTLARAARMAPWLMTTQAWCAYLLVSLGLILSALIPPLQSPDEPAHLVRAYLFSQGQWLLEAPPTRDVGSGGYVDDGLIEYASIFDRVSTKPDATLKRAELAAAQAIRWKRTRSFVAASGTAYYLPVAYLPQAAAFFVGEQLGLTVDRTYRLARLFAFAGSLAVMALALRLFPANTLTLVLLILPMSVFQLLSASLDGWTTALALLVIALFMRGMQRRYAFSPWMMYLLAMCALLLACSRTHLLPLTVLPLLIGFQRRSWAGIPCTAVTALLSLAWLLFAVKTTVLGPERLPVSAGIVGLYLHDPLALVRVLTNTFQHDDTMEFYGQSFVGILGWLDTRYPDEFYEASAYVLIAAAVLSLSYRGLPGDAFARVVLLALALLCSVLVLVALLITWTPHPATIVMGVQGRYFLVPALMAAYAVSGDDDVLAGLRGALSVALVAAYGVLVAYSMAQLLVSRYYA